MASWASAPGRSACAWRRDRVARSAKPPTVKTTIAGAVTGGAAGIVEVAVAVVAATAAAVAGVKAGVKAAAKVAVKAVATGSRRWRVVVKAAGAKVATVGSAAIVVVAKRAAPIAPKVVSPVANSHPENAGTAEIVVVAAATVATVAAVAKPVPIAASVAIGVTAPPGCRAKSAVDGRSARNTSRARRPAAPTWSRCPRRWGSDRVRWLLRATSVPMRKGADAGVAAAGVAVVVASVAPVKED